jgi:hypothetical protein
MHDRRRRQSMSVRLETQQGRPHLIHDELGWWLPVRITARCIADDEVLWAGCNVRRDDDSNCVTFWRAVREGDGDRSGRWRARLGPFAAGDRVDYFALRQSPRKEMYTALRRIHFDAHSRFLRKNPANPRLHRNGNTHSTTQEVRDDKTKHEETKQATGH